MRHFAPDNLAGPDIGGSVKAVIIVAVVIAVLVGAYLGASAVFAGKVRQELAALKANGLPVTPAELAARYGEGENPTGRVLNAAAANLGNDIKPRLSEIESLAAMSNLTAADSVVMDKADVVSALMAVADSPPARFGLRYEDGFSASLPGILPALPAFQKLLSIKARALARAGRPDSALQVLRAAIRMVDVMGEPCLIHLLAGLVGFDSTCALIVRYAPAASPAAREAVRKELSRLDLKALLARAVATEAIMTEVTVLKQDPVTDGKSRASFVPWLKMAPLRNSARYVALTVKRRNLDALALPWWEGRGEVERIKSLSKRGLYSQVAWVASPNVLLFYARTERAAARQGLALLALAASDYRTNSGRLPTRLEEFGAEIPPDPFTGRPLCYRADSNGFTVWSTGADRTDDSGDAEKDIALRAEL